MVDDIHEREKMRGGEKERDAYMEKHRKLTKRQREIER